MSSSQLEAQQRQLQAHEAKQVRLSRNAKHVYRDLLPATSSAGVHALCVLQQQPTCSGCNAKAHHVCGELGTVC